MKRVAVNLVVLSGVVLPVVACGSSGTFVTSPDLGPRAPWKFGSPVNVRAVTRALTEAGIHGLHLTQEPPAQPIFVLVQASRGPMTLWVNVSQRPQGGAINVIRRSHGTRSGQLPGYVEKLRVQHTNVKNLAIVYVARGRFLTQIRAAISALKR